MTLCQALGFFALCLLASLTWLMADLLPTSFPPIMGQGFRLMLVGVASLLIHVAGRSRVSRPSVAHCVMVGMGSLGLIGIPLLLLAFAAGKVSSTCGVLMFAGMPILLVILGASASADSGLRSLPYGLLGIAGILILLPISVPQGFVGMFGLGAVLLAMVSTGLSLLWLHRLLNSFPVFVAVSLAGFINGGLLIGAGSFSGRSGLALHGMGPEVLRGLLFDLPEVILLMWLARIIVPQRLSARYLVSPFLTVVEGWFVLRPGFDGRTLLGLVLLGTGAYCMLGRDDGAREPTLNLRDLTK